jgi:dTDP-4-amino-4,6-dideoxygalactose transaminase
MEDGSYAHGATYKNKKVGTFGNSSAFSMQGKKTLTGGEGGFLLTNDENVFYRALLLGHYNKRCKQEIPNEHELYSLAVTGMGLKFRIHPVAAAIAEEQFQNFFNFFNK